MSANTVKIIGTVLALGLAVLGHMGVVPVDSEITSTVAALLAGWLHLPQPGAAK